MRSGACSRLQRNELPFGATRRVGWLIPTATRQQADTPEAEAYKQQNVVGLVGVTEPVADTELGAQVPLVVARVSR
jgi:hypothetical protein